MRIPQSYIQKCKVVGHVFQALFIFSGLCMAIVVSAKGGATGGATKFYLALVSLVTCFHYYRHSGVPRMLGCRG